MRFRWPIGAVAVVANKAATCICMLQLVKPPHDRHGGFKACDEPPYLTIDSSPFTNSVDAPPLEKLDPGSEAKMLHGRYAQGRSSGARTLTRVDPLSGAVSRSNETDARLASVQISFNVTPNRDASLSAG